MGEYVSELRGLSIKYGWWYDKCIKIAVRSGRIFAHGVRRKTDFNIDGKLWHVMTNVLINLI